MTAWMFVTRWGNALLLLPTASWIATTLWASGERAVAARWAAAFGGAIVAVLASKVAFLGWGVGSREFDFTGISGHSMLAAAVLPMLGWWLVQDRDASTRARAVAAGAVLAIVVGLSRVLVSAHSASEVVAGLALGLAVASCAIPRGPGTGHPVRARWLALTALVAVGSLTQIGDADEAHGVVVRLALAWSGHDAPFTREML